MEGSSEDLYVALRVQRDATFEQIGKAYTDMVRNWLHYKTNVSNVDIRAVKKIKALLAAYRILKDSEEREKYDRKLGLTNAAVPSPGSEQTFAFTVGIPRESERDEQQSEAGVGTTGKEESASSHVAMNNVFTVGVPVVERRVGTQDEASGIDELSVVAIGADAENAPRNVNATLPQDNVIVSNKTSVSQIEEEIVTASNGTSVREIEEPVISDSFSYFFGLEPVTAEELWKMEIIHLWRNAIELKDAATLLSLFKESASNFWNSEREGRTALHVAAMDVGPQNFELAKLVLDLLMERTQITYTHIIWPQFHDMRTATVGDYIGDIEKVSGKSAMGLAKENFEKSPYSKAIGEYIIDTLSRSKQHEEIDLAVRERKDHEIVYGDVLGVEFLSILVKSRDCTLLLKAFEEQRVSKFWKYRDGSGRTVLHVAAMQGCFSLARKFLDLARGAGDREYIEAVDSQSSLTALQMAEDIIGNRSIAEYIKFTVKCMEDKDYVHPCFFEAYPRTYWHIGLATGNCDLLMELLIDPRLLLETYKGLTVLHVGIMCQRSDLVKKVLDLFGDRKEIVFGDSSQIFPTKLTWVQMIRKEITCDGEVFDDVALPEFRSTDSRNCERVISRFRSLMGKESFTGSARELAKFIQAHNNGEGVSENNPLVEALEGDETVDAVDESTSVLGTNYSEIIIDEYWNEDWNMGYEADVDFNFEEQPRSSLLRLHYACKYPLVFRNFIRNVRDRCKGMGLMATYVCDGQGRSSYHICMNHRNNKDHFPGGLVLREACKDTGIDDFDSRRDAKGRSLLDIILTKNYLQNNILFKDMPMKSRCVEIKTVHDNDEWTIIRTDDNEEGGFSFYSQHDNYALSFMFYLIAKVLKQSNVSDYIWSNILEKDISKLKSLSSQFKPILLAAASIGDQQLLGILLLEGKIDSRIVDKSQRTALHHAANPTLLEFATLSQCPWIGHCFSTVSDVCKFHKKWNMERRKSAWIFPKRDPENYNEVEKLLIVGRMACILMLVQAGVDLSQEDTNKKVPSIGPTNDVDYQKWWYNLVVQDATDKKNSFNQAAGALSVVGTLVAATSYIGPLQPPMAYNDNGYVRLGMKLIEVFMVSNTLAFYFAMASVTVAVVPALPMPQESVLSELKRAQHIVAISLVLLLCSIVFIILSFAATSLVVIQDQQSLDGSALLTFPSILGWILCFCAIISFLIRMLRLIFYKNPIIRDIYTFSISNLCKEIGLKCCEKVCSMKDTYWRPHRAITLSPT